MKIEMESYSFFRQFAKISSLEIPNQNKNQSFKLTVHHLEYAMVRGWLACMTPRYGPLLRQKMFTHDIVVRLVPAE